VQLRRAVEAWEPRNETVPLHAWLHPWLPSLGDRLQDLYPGIRFKLAAALQHWDPDDMSALALLQPWRTVCVTLRRLPIPSLLGAVRDGVYVCVWFSV
jgi:tuftelin-interacting protein 11